MRESRVKRNIIILAGVATLLLVGIVLGWYFVLQRPQKTLLAAAQTEYETQLATAKKLPRALADQKKAEDRLQYIKGQFDFLRRRYRNVYFSDLGADYGSETPLQKANREAIWRYLLNYYYNGYGPALQRELQDYATASGVNIVSLINVVSPPNKPEDVVPPPSGLIKPIGASTGSAGAPASAPGAAPGVAAGASGDGALSVTIVGPLPNILRYFDALNTNTTLVRVGTIKLDTDAGPPVQVRATFSLLPYLLSNGPGAPIFGSAAPASNAARGVAPARPGATPAPLTASVSNNASSNG